MTMSDKFRTFCLFCFGVGVVLPFGLMTMAALLGLVGTGDLAARISAYAMVGGLVVLFMSYLVMRVLNRGGRSV
jgi:hypothetical protein